MMLLLSLLLFIHLLYLTTLRQVGSAIPTPVTPTCAFVDVILSSDVCIKCCCNLAARCGGISKGNGKVWNRKDGETKAVYRLHADCCETRWKETRHLRSSSDETTGGHLPPILAGRRKQCFPFTGIKQAHGLNCRSKRETKTVRVVIGFTGVTAAARCESHCVCFPPRWLNTHSPGHQKHGNRYLPKSLSGAKCSWTIEKGENKPSRKKNN